MTDDTTTRRRPATPAVRRLRRPAALLGAVALVAAGATAVTVGSPAQAADTPRTALGKQGQKLSVSASANIDPAGETLRVTGEGYDDTKGVYVAVCKDNGDNRVPTPCLGGADQSGSSGSSVWIIPRDASDEGAGTVAERWGEGGTFDVDLGVKAKDSGLDCLEVACSVVTRVDHNGPGDRSQDVRIPITFEGHDPGDGDGDGDGVDVPPGTVSYVKAAEFTTAGRPLDLLLHPGSGKLYVGSDNIPDTSDVAEQGLYVLDPGDGKVLGHIAQAPGPNGAMAARVVRRIAGPLPGDGVVFHYPLRGIGTAKQGDAVARGVWFNGATFTGVGQDADTSTVLVAAGPELRRVEIATGAVRDTVTLEGGNQLGVDAARGTAWSVGTSEGKPVLRRVDTATFEVTATAELPADSVFFVEPDPATGNVWVASGTSVLVFDKDGKPLTTLTGADRPTAAAFDKTTGRAFVLREDLSESTSDQNGSLQILDSATFRRTADPLSLAGSLAGAYAGVAVTPGAASVYVTKQAESKVVKLDLRMSPKVTQSPTDQSADPGDEVTFVAAAEGTPEPTVRWQVSPDGGQTWSALEGATKNAYSFTARAAQNGYRYRAEFTNAVGTTRTAPITLTVTESTGDGGATGGGDGGEESEPSGSRTETGSEGQKLTVTPVNHLATENQTLKVTGAGYDTDKGVYVALCVDNGDGELPTPCVGGVDMSGASHSSAWISSNPPDYGQDLAIPYGDGGSFEVELSVDAKDEFTDCFKARCVLATRADHTLSGDRSQDVKVPVSFVGQDPVDTDPEPGDTGGTGGPGSSGGTTGGARDTAGGSTTGSTGGGTGTSTAGGGLASTGLTVISAAALAAALTATGWVAYRRGRRVE
ncbi:immunoglobulin domain-containing protein [Streptomyces viridochromogenes]|uniref:immunoglobulin domain-containing protein n=1 Tax=Streptomyces viridochromogenes TaxID=1938 RepID=UPI00069D87D5|nr:immunoglobulin domain-containing protein [Streptomyces viridochromogenes]KOG21985.1 immunoglobulin I-set domain protein [Streptomyces viridochromogenes]KOG29924.1 immunoglobulin I-set domain protein [Streptomyces viridochromogenes]